MLSNDANKKSFVFTQQQGQVFIYLLKILQACSVAGRRNVPKYVFMGSYI